MREIKFRYTVVRPNGHVFHKDFTVQEMECGDACGWMNANMVGRYVQVSELHRRQFTGMNDRNGKAIWESDKFRFGDGEHVCLFYNGSFGWEEDGEFYDLRLVYSCVEVIGNIYEKEAIRHDNL